MIIHRAAQLAGKDCAPYGVLHASDRALDFWRVLPGRCWTSNGSRCVQLLVEVGLLTRAGSKGECQGQQLADRVVRHGDGLVVPQHCSRAPFTELSDDFRESTEEAIDRTRGHSGFSRQAAHRERLGAAAPNDLSRHTE